MSQDPSSKKRSHECEGNPPNLTDTNSSEPPTKVAKLAETSDASSSSPHATALPNTPSTDASGTQLASPQAKPERDDSRRGRTILSFGYLGEGYQGLQTYASGLTSLSSDRHASNLCNLRQYTRNDKAKTIEPVLLEALVKAGATGLNNPTLDDLRWDRCARTDKGVSAACNFVSLNMKYVQTRVLFLSPSVSVHRSFLTHPF